MSPDVLAAVVVTTIKRSIEPMIARVAALEARVAEPGPPGPAGPQGNDGRNGQDGAGIDDVAIEFDGDRSLAFKVTRGGVVKSIPVSLPFMRYQGTYTEHYAYVVGDVVTCSGNAWHCEVPTTYRPGTSTAWRLMVRKGRDGKDVPAAPVATGT